MKATIKWDDFEKIDIRVGQIEEVNDFIGARKPAYQLKINFGSDIGVLKSSAQITDLYEKQNLLNKQVIAIVNFEPKQIGNFMSQCLVMGVYDKEGIILLGLGKKAENGARIG